jgi:hypothetical protein
MLSENPNAIHLLKESMDKIDWDWLLTNPNAIHLLECNPEKIDWFWLSINPNAIHLLKENMDKIDWYFISTNPAIFELDYNAIKERCYLYKEELIIKAIHPSRIEGYLEMGINMEDLDDYI